jgi:hypothetical protein
LLLGATRDEQHGRTRMTDSKALREQGPATARDGRVDDDRIDPRLAGRDLLGRVRIVRGHHAVARRGEDLVDEIADELLVLDDEDRQTALPVLPGRKRPGPRPPGAASLSACSRPRSRTSSRS